MEDVFEMSQNSSTLCNLKNITNITNKQIMYSHIQINLGQLSISLVNINLGQHLFWILRLGPHYRVNNWPII
jgi:hypothetical protein